LNAGVCIDRQVTSIEVKSNYDGTSITLGDIILPDEDIPSQYFINEKDIEKWNYFKGAKNEQRTNKTNGFVYNYTEGAMVFPDPLNMPSRTIITGEGGAAPSRFKHVIKTKSGKLRRLTPVELERLNMFPDNHTEGASDIKRAFFMGNALVVGIVEKVGKILSERL
jgi:DNA (cytosine-5)-methyltransferase 1